jgi:hypothetical protein
MPKGARLSVSRQPQEVTASPLPEAGLAKASKSAGWITEIAYLPFSYGGPSFWPWLNARIGVQYTFFNKFDGATTNFNGNGRNAHNNNTLFVYTWIAF